MESLVTHSLLLILHFSVCFPPGEDYSKQRMLKSSSVPSWRKAWQPTLIFLLGESHGQRSLAGYTVHRVTKSRT